MTNKAELTDKLSYFNSLMRNVSDFFTKILGSSAGIPIAVLVMTAWIGYGYLEGFNDAWKWNLSLFTSIVTFLMVFIIQHAQLRDTRELHIKLAEIIRATEGTASEIIDLKVMTDEELEEVERDICKDSSSVQLSGKFSNEAGVGLGLKKK